jgi:hypothetical protein
METTQQAVPEPQSPRTSPATEGAAVSAAPPPFARCRVCEGAIGRSEQVFFFQRSKTVAHIRCWS